MPNQDQEKTLKEYAEKNEGGVGKPITYAPKFEAATPLQELAQSNKIGYQPIPIKDLPSMGMFYPEGTEITIRPATSGEIRHWSTLQERDLSALDDMLNYIMERCVTIKFGEGKLSSWKDLKEVDRFYLLLAVREYTFIKGDNKLQINISEGKKIDVSKEMIDYINFDERLLDRYDQEKRCFVLRFLDGKELSVSIPSVGVTSWLKNYYRTKEQKGESFDKAFSDYAPFTILDWRGLNNNSYEKMVEDSYNWGIDQISAIVEIKKLFLETINPVIKYQDETGTEMVAPISFQGGIKSILLISNPFGKLV